MKNSSNKTILFKNNYLNISDYFEIPQNYVECIISDNHYDLVVCCYELNVDYDVMQSIYRYANGLKHTIQDFLNLKT